MRQILLILTLTALMAAFLAFGSSGVAFAQDEPAVVADSIPTKEDCKEGGWKALGYKNQGECIEAATQDEQDVDFGAVFVFPALLLGGAVLLRRNNKK